MTEKRQCCRLVFHNDIYLGRETQCKKHGKYEHEGEYYCATHHPPMVAAREAIRNSQYDADLKDMQEQRAEEALAVKALEWLRANRPDVVKELEGK